MEEEEMPETNVDPAPTVVTPDVPQQLKDLGDKWYNNQVVPFYNDNKDAIYEAAMQAVVDENGILPEVCSKGQACRDERKKALQTELQKQWKTVIDNFYDSVEGALLTTQQKITAGYVDFVKCGDENPCCETNEKTMENWYITITNEKEKIYGWQLDKQRLQLELDEIQNECPAEW